MQLTNRIRFVMALLLLTVPLFGRSYTTNFPSPPAPENPISEQSNWINGKANGLDWSNVSTTSASGARGQQQPDTGLFDDSTALVTGTWGPDETVQATVRNVSTNAIAVMEVELRLRSTITAHSNTGYEITW